MEEGAHLTAAKDREGRFSGYYKCSLCVAEFRPNPDNREEMMITFAHHVREAHPSQKSIREDVKQEPRES
jgi:predicted small metal-binding protein